MLRASSLGGCVRSLVAQEQGYSTVEPPAIVAGWFERGTQHELDCVDAMHADGWIVEGQQREVEYLGVSGHLDGITWQEDPYPNMAERVLEVKAPSAWSRFEKAYRTDDWSDPYMHIVGVQLSVYMLAMGMEAVVACCDGERVKWFGVERPPFDADYIAARVEQVRGWVTGGTLPPCSQRDFPCPFRFLCQDNEERVTLDDPDLAASLHRYQELTAVIKAAETERKGLKIDVPVGRYSVDGIDLTVYTQAGRKHLDEDAMRLDGLDPEKYRKQGAESIRWKVS